MDSGLVKQASDFRKKSFAHLIKAKAKTTKRVLKKREVQKRPLPSQLVGKKTTKGKRAAKTDESIDLKLKKARTRFSLLAAIVECLKSAYLNNNRVPMTLDEVLAATDNADTSFTDRAWLLETALPSNKRVKLVGEILSYCPPYELTDKRSLFDLLIRYDRHGLGGVLLDDVRESIANFDHVMRVLRHHYCHVTRKDTEKDVLFLYEPSLVADFDEEFVRLWKSAIPEGLEDAVKYI